MALLKSKEMLWNDKKQRGTIFTFEQKYTDHGDTNHQKQKDVGDTDRHTVVGNHGTMVATLGPPVTMVAQLG